MLRFSTVNTVDSLIMTQKSGATLIQEVPAFRDFWYQKGITKFGDHKF